MMHCCKQVQLFSNVFENYVYQELEEYENLYNHEHYFEDKELPPSQIVHIASNDIQFEPEEKHENNCRVKALLNETKTVSPSEMVFNNLNFSDQLAKPFKTLEDSEDYDVPEFIEMPELHRKSEEDEELDDFTLLAGLAINNEAY